MEFARRGRSRRRRLTAVLAAAVLTGSVLVTAARPAYAADESISVNFATASGAPTYRASGWTYGMTENGANPPDRFFTDVRFRYLRAGGAQLDSPGGWVSGRYDRRWDSTRAQLLRTRSLGGEFILLVHDLWGADGYPIRSTSTAPRTNRTRRGGISRRANGGSTTSTRHRPARSRR